jgi:hypothetical protein
MSAVAATAAELSLEPAESDSGSPPAHLEPERRTVTQPTSQPAESAQEEDAANAKPLTAARPQLLAPISKAPVVIKGGLPPPPPPLPPASYKPAAKPASTLCDQNDTGQAGSNGRKKSGLQSTGAVPQGLLLEIENAALNLRRKKDSHSGGSGGGSDGDAASTAKGGSTDLRR